VKKILIIIISAIFLSGCSTTKLNGLRRDTNITRHLTETIHYSKKEVFDASLLAINNRTNLIVRYSDLEKGEIFAQNSYLVSMSTALILGSFGSKIGTLGVFLEGDNPTHIEIVQKNSGIYNEDFKNVILKEIKFILENLKE